MNSNRVSIKSMVAILSDLSGRTDLDDRIDLLSEYALEAERKIGTRKWLNEHRQQRLYVQDYRAKLPDNFYDADNIDTCVLNNCTCGTNPCSCSACSCGTTCDNVWTNLCSCGNWAYYYKTKVEDYRIEGCWLITPFKTGSVYMDYFTIPVDGNGYPEVMQSHRDAIVAYCLWQLKTSEYLTKQIPESMWYTLKNRWEELCAQARGIDNLPSRWKLSRTAAVNNDPWKTRRGIFGNYGGGGWW